MTEFNINYDVFVPKLCDSFDLLNTKQSKAEIQAQAGASMPIT